MILLFSNIMVKNTYKMIKRKTEDKIKWVDKWTRKSETCRRKILTTMLITLKSVSLYTRNMCIDQVNLITNNCKLVSKNLTSCLLYFHPFQCNKLHWISQPKTQQLWSFSMQAIRNWTEGISKQDTVD